MKEQRNLVVLRGEIYSQIRFSHETKSGNMIYEFDLKILRKKSGFDIIPIKFNSNQCNSIDLKKNYIGEVFMVVGACQTIKINKNTKVYVMASKVIQEKNPIRNGFRSSF